MAVCLLMIGASGCSYGQQTDFCVLSQAIRPTVRDTCTISQNLVDQLLAHNELGKELCGWHGDNTQANCEVSK